MPRSFLGARRRRRLCAHAICLLLGTVSLGTTNLGIAGLGTSGLAVTHATSPPNDLDQLVERAWDEDATLRAASLSAQAQRKRANAATRERGDLQLDAGVGLMTMGDAMAPTWMLSAGVSTEFRPAGLSRAEAHAADVQAGFFECGAVVRALTLRADVERLVLRAELLQENERLLQTELQQLGSVHKLLQAQAQQGLAELSLAVRVESLVATLERQTFALEAERLELEAAWNAVVPGGTFEELALPDAWFHTTPPQFETLEARDVQATIRHWEREAMRAERSVEEASRRIRWSVGGTYGRSAMMTSAVDMVPSHTAMATVGVAIPRTGAANGRVAALQAELDASSQQDEQSARLVQRDWQSLAAQHDALAQQLERTETRLKPLNDALRRAFERSLRSGQRAWSEYLDAVLATTELERGVVELRAELQALRIEMDTLSDGQLSGRAPLLSGCAAGNAPEVTQ